MALGWQSPARPFCLYSNKIETKLGSGSINGEMLHSRYGQTLNAIIVKVKIWQRLARFVRKTLLFSKNDVMHEICLFLFLHRYNNELTLYFD
jgi:hypothetical protein